MNEVVVLSQQRRVRVHRSFFTESGEQSVEELDIDFDISSSSSPTSVAAVFFPGEELTVSVSEEGGEEGASAVEFLFETDQGKSQQGRRGGGGGGFLAEEGGCGHSRTASAPAVLTLPRHRTEVQVWVGKLN